MLNRCRVCAMEWPAVDKRGRGRPREACQFCQQLIRTLDRLDRDLRRAVDGMADPQQVLVKHFVRSFVASAVNSATNAAQGRVAAQTRKKELLANK